MGNAASNEAAQQQPQGAGREANPLGRPRSHGGTISQPPTPGSSLGRGWSRHGSLRRGASQTPAQHHTHKPLSRESSTRPNDRSAMSSFSASSSAAASGRRARADSASNATVPKFDISATRTSRERAVTSSLDSSPVKQSGPADRSVSIGQGLSSHLLRRPSKYGAQKSTKSQEFEKEFQQQSVDSDYQAFRTGRAAAPALDLSSAEFAPQALVSPYHSPTVVADASSASGKTTIHVGTPTTSPHLVPLATRPFGRGIAAIFAHSSQASAPPSASATQFGNVNSESEAIPERAGAPNEVPPADNLGHQLTAALPSYLKIPTLIPSKQQPAPPSTAPSSPIGSLGASVSGNVTPNSSGWSSAVAHTGKATDAVLTTEEVVIAPGDASKVSSPCEEYVPRTPTGEDAERRMSLSSASRLEGRPVTHAELQSLQDTIAPTYPSVDASHADYVDAASSGVASLSRTPTPTQRSHAAKALTPARLDKSDGNYQQQEQDLMRKVYLEPGLASGATTPVMPLPPGLTSAPPSAVSPALSKAGFSNAQSAKSAPVDVNAPQPHVVSTAASSNAVPSPNEASTTPTTTSATAKSRPPAHFSPYYWRNAQGPISLMPIVLTWRGGGKEVFVTGTFANEWRSKILLKRSSGGSVPSSSNTRSRTSGAKEEHTVVLHLPPGTHRMKFIVDDRWRVSRELPTATDGDGNLVNYLEIPNVGPAHPGPLSAPGEDLLDDTTKERARRTERGIERVKEAERAGKRRSASGDVGQGRASDAGNGLERAQSMDAGDGIPSPKDGDSSAHGELQGEVRRKAVLDLREEARRAEFLRNGQLEEVFGVDDDVLRAAETWVQTVPASVLRAQEEDEEYRERLEAEGIDPNQNRTLDEDDDAPSIPPPPSLPRQLEKVILNSSPANPALAPPGGLVDDNSILPAPNHVVLNHLTASAIKGGVLAVGTTTRYKRKYVTTVFYRPVQT